MERMLLVYAMFTVSATLFISTFIFSIYRKMSYLRYFSYSYALFLISYSLLSIQTTNNLILSSIISNTALMGGYLLFYSSFIRYFLKRDHFPTRFWFYLIASFAVSYIFGILSYQYFIRNSLMGALTVIIFLDFGWFLFRQKHQMSQFMRGAIFTSLITNIITNTTRPILAILLLEPSNLPIDSQILNVFVFTSYSVTSIFWFATIIIMDADILNKSTQKNEEKYLSLVESIHSAILLVEKGGNINYMNHHAHEMFLFLDKSKQSNIKTTLESINAHEVLALMDEVNLKQESLTLDLDLEINHNSFTFHVDVHPIKDKQHQLYAMLIIFTDVSKQKAIENQISQSEKNYRSMFFEAAEGRLIVDNAQIIECNDAAATLLKSNREDIIGLNLQDITPEFQPNGRQSLELGLEIQRKSEEHHISYFEWTHKALDGSEFIVMVSIIHIIYNNKPMSLITWQDITAQKRAEFDMIKLTRAVEQSPVSIVITDKEGRIEYANPMASETTGYSLEELLGQNPRILQSGYTSKDEYAQLWNEVTQGSQWKGLFHNKKKNGEYYWESSLISPVYDTFGNITNYIAIKEDVTEKKRIEESLIVNQNRLEQIAQHSRTVIWEMNVEGQYTYLNEVCLDIYGYTQQEMIGKTRDHFTPLMPLSNLEYAPIGFDLLRSGQSINAYENKILRKDGTSFWVSTSAKPIFNENDEIIGFIGSDNDINERKRVEEEMIRFKTMADQATYGNAIVSMDGTLIYVNNMFASMQGYSMDNLIGMNLMSLHPENQKKRVQQLLNIIKTQGGFVAEEIQFIRKDASLFPALMSATLIVDSNQVPQFMSASIIDISDIKRKEEEINRLSIAIEQSPVIVLISDLKGVIQYVNPAFEAITGYSSNEVVGQHTRMLKSGLTDKKTYQDLWKTILLGKVWKGEWINRRKDGELFYESVIVTPVKDSQNRISYFLAVKENITQRKQIEEALVKSEEQFRTLFTHSPVGMLIHDIDSGDILDCNPESLNMLGLSSMEAVADFIMTKDNLGFFKMYLEKIKEVVTHGLIQFEGQYLKATHEAIWVRVSLSPLQIGDNLRVLSIAMNITKEKQAENDKIARQVAEESNRVKSIFFSNMSHEIRTPLNAINGFAQILSRDESLTLKQREQIKTIHQSGQHLITLINDILDISKIEAGRLTLIEKEFNLIDMLKEIQMMFSLSAKEKNLFFDFDVAHHVPRYIISDESKIRQVMINLIGNAIKFTNEGGIRVNVQIDMQSDNTLQVDVIDTGHGLSDDEIEHLFDPFWQSSKGTNAGGTGLGLPISKNIIELLGGRIGVESQYQKGSRFSFTVVFKPSLQDNNQQQIMDQTFNLRVEKDRYRVCVVDDHDDNRRVLREMLESIGFMVKECQDGLEAVDCFDSWHPHIILMDMKMPVMDGFEAIRQIRKHPLGHAVSIIGITASVFDDDLNTVLLVGANHVLTKPLDEQEFLLLLTRLPGIDYEVLNELKSESLLEVRYTLHSLVPTQLRHSMRKAIDEGNMIQLRKLAVEVKDYSEDVYEQIINLARNYDYEQLNALLKSMGDEHE